MHNPITRFEAGGATHVGNVRQQNEDSYLVATPAGVWAVADGMGGHAAGDLASQTVVEELRQIVTPSSAAELLASCEASMVAANTRLRRIADPVIAALGLLQTVPSLVVLALLLPHLGTGQRPALVAAQNSRRESPDRS